MIPSYICQALEAYFDKIFVVTVPRFKERQQEVEETLKGLNFSFFYGVDKLQIDADSLKANGEFDEVMSIKLQRTKKVMNTGEIACSLSHRKLYEEIVAKNYERVLILEDDVIPVYSVISSLPTALKELPDNWELVYFGFLKNYPVTAKLRTKRLLYLAQSAFGFKKWSYSMVKKMLPVRYSPLLHKAGFHDCTHAYAVSNAGAVKLIQKQSPVVFRADDLLSNAVLTNTVNAYITTPLYFDQKDFSSQDKSSTIKEL